MNDLARYHRQMLLPDVGEEGQRKLAASHALVVGCGALGTVIADALCRAGVGRLTIVDRDVVEVTNLQRQTLFDEADAAAGLPKAEAARRRLGAINSGVVVRAVVADFTPGCAEVIAGVGRKGGDGLGPVNVILDGTDNVETRMLLNDLAVKHGVPYVYAGAVGTEAMSMTVLPRGGARGEAGATPCLRCVFPEPPAPGSMPTCDTAGVLGPVVGMIANLQAIEALKVLLGCFDLVSRSLLRFDPWRLERQRVDVASLGADGACPCCGERSFEWLEGGRAQGPVALCGRDAVQVSAPANGRIDLVVLSERLGAFGEFTTTRFLTRGDLEGEARDERNGQPATRPIGLTVFADGRAIVEGTVRLDRARAIYAKYVGA
jgi:adenylyltransferase/sulfurtransferase